MSYSERYVRGSPFQRNSPQPCRSSPPSLSEGDLAGKHIPNPGPNVVMHSEVGPWGKRHFGGSQFELIVKFSQMAEDNLFEFDFRRDAPCVHGFLSRQGMCAAKQYDEEQQCEPHHRLLQTFAKDPQSSTAVHRSEIFPLMSVQGQKPNPSETVACQLSPAPPDIGLRRLSAAMCHERTSAAQQISVFGLLRLSGDLDLNGLLASVATAILPDGDASRGSLGFRRM